MRNNYLAIFWMIGTLISFVVMAIGVRELSLHLSVTQILFLRSIIALLIVSVMLSYNTWQQVVTRSIVQHIIRNIAHFGGQLAWFYAIAIMPLADVFAIELTAPIWAAILAVILIGEKITMHRFVAIVFGMVGVLIILRPTISVINPAAIVMLIGAVCFGFSYIVTKTLSINETPLCILFYMSCIQLVLSSIPAFSVWLTPSAEDWIWLMTIGVTVITAHYCMVRAFMLGEVVFLLPIDFLRLPIISVVGFILYNEKLDWFLFLGAILVVTGNFINIKSEK